MSSSMFTHISKYISLGAKSGGLAALLLAASLEGTSVRAQQQAQQQQIPVAQPAGAVSPLPAVSNTNTTAPVQPVGYVSTDSDISFQDLQAQVAQQQVQLQAQQAQVQKLVEQLQTSGGSADGGSAAQAPAAGTGPAPYIVGSDRVLAGAYGPGGPVFSTKNGDFKFHPRGLVQMDLIAPGPPGALGGINNQQTQDSVEFRRLRLGADGTMYENIDWVMECDLAFALQNVDPNNGAAPSIGLRNVGTIYNVANGNAITNTSGQGGNTMSVIQPTTCFMTFKEVPIVGNIRVGNQQDWISFEHIQSARFTDFMERSPIMDAFFGPNNNGYIPGVSFFRTTENQRANIQFGGYHNSVYDSGYTYDVGSGAWIGGGRATWCPYYDEATNGRYMIHTGFGAEYRTFNSQLNSAEGGDNVRVRSRGVLRTQASTLDVNYVDTGNFYARSQTCLCPELVWQHGPFMIQGEYAYSNFGGAAVQKGGKSLGHVAFNGGYIEALYFLTGENRQYNRQSGVFDRVVPFQNAFSTRTGQFGWGGWQPGVRVDWLNLNSGGIQGGQEIDTTFGINWFLNANSRFMLNYVVTHVDNAAQVAQGSAALGGTGVALAGSRPVGNGYLQTLGLRMDFNW